jgi:hypothetical protein
MTEFTEYTHSADDLDGAKSCSCPHCRSEGRYDQDATCLWYRRPTQEPAPVINRARKQVS